MFNKKTKLIFCTIFLFVIILNFVYSAPPVTTVQEFPEGYIISENPHEYLKLNQNYQYNFFLYNHSNGILIDNSSTNCTFFLANYSGEVLFSQDVEYIPEEDYWKLDIFGGNFSEAGYYTYGVTCQGTKGGSLEGVFEVTESGIEITESRSSLVLGLFGLLVIFLFLSLFSLFKTENPMGKFALYWLSHVLFTLISFVAWQIGVEGLLGGFALIGIFRVLFWIGIISIFPMVLLSMAWIFYYHTVNDHMKKMMEKGEDPETAFSMAKKKARRKKY